MGFFELEDNKLYLYDTLNLRNAEKLFENVSHYLDKNKYKKLLIDLQNLKSIDSAGVIALDQIVSEAKKKGINSEIINVPPHIKKTINIFSSLKLTIPEKRIKKINFIERMGEEGYNFWFSISYLLQLSADTFIWAIIGIFSKKGQRKGEFVNQSNLIGVNALPIIALISFLVGFILSLQSAQQLRQFGANIFVVDLISISMTREMGPLMTAILLAGRSGSAIASEIATMKISEELDALKTMALNPVKYVALPKLYAMLVSTPLLTIFSDIIGIFGGFLVGISFLKIDAVTFVDRMVSVMELKDIITSIVKSFVFAWLISIVSFYFGFRAKGGAGGVGKATTASVVAAIFMVIVADSLLGLLFY